MMKDSTVVSIEIVHTNCGTHGCGIHFGLERSFYDARHKDGKTFYCPNGHNVSWSNSENDKLRAEKLRLEASVEWERKRVERLNEKLAVEQKKVSVQKGRATRFKNNRDQLRTRIVNGVCPCCNRHFADSKIVQHMETKHPEYVAEARKQPAEEES